MAKLILALLGIRKELRRIREILEIVHQEELELHEMVLDYSKSSIDDDEERELEARLMPLRDEYGETIKDDDDDDWKEENREKLNESLQ